jgi:hypothetical protein
MRDPELRREWVAHCADLVHNVRIDADERERQEEIARAVRWKEHFEKHRMQFNDDEQKEWNQTEAVLANCNLLFNHLHENKPEKSDAAGLQMWEQQLEETRKWARSIGDRRITICVNYWKRTRK